MLPATTLPAAVPAGQDAAACDAACAGHDAAPRHRAVCGTSWRDHRKTAPRNADAALTELQAMGSLWRNADGVIEEGPVPPEGIVVIGARPGAYAPGIDVTAVPQAAGPIAGGTGLGIVPALVPRPLIWGALQRAGVPARAVRSTSPMLGAETILTAPLHRAGMNMPAVRGQRTQHNCAPSTPPATPPVTANPRPPAIRTLQRREGPRFRIPRQRTPVAHDFYLVSQA